MSCKRASLGWMSKQKESYRTSIKKKSKKPKNDKQLNHLWSLLHSCGLEGLKAPCHSLSPRSAVKAPPGQAVLSWPGCWSSAESTAPRTARPKQTPPPTPPIRWEEGDSQHAGGDSSFQPERNKQMGVWKTRLAEEPRLCLEVSLQINFVLV